MCRWQINTATEKCEQKEKQKYEKQTKKKTHDEKNEGKYMKVCVCDNDGLSNWWLSKWNL